jgi:hypothetical protein
MKQLIADIASLVVMIVVALGILLYADWAVAEIRDSANEVYRSLGIELPPGRPDPQPSNPSLVPYDQIQGAQGTHYQVTPEYGYGTVNGQSYSTHKFGNTTLINAGKNSTTCQTVGKYTWCN